MAADITVEEVTAALKDVYDPEIPVNVVDLGLIYGIDVDEVLKRARRDVIQHRRAENRLNPDPHFLTFGPKNRREFFANLKARGGSPV